MSATARERLDFHSWRERLSESFLRLDVRPLVASDELSTRVAVATNGRVRCATIDVRGEPHLVRRTRRPAQSEDASLLVSLQLDGECIVRQGDRETLLRPRDIAVYDATRPYDLVFPAGDHRQLVLQVPILFASASFLPGQTAIRVDGNDGVGRAAAALLTSLPRAVPESGAVEAERLADAALSLLALSLSRRAKPSRSADLLARARSFIEENADDPDLRPSSVATGLHLSLAHLHRVFQGTPTTVGETLRNVRLDRAAADLRDARFRDWTVAEVAHRRGFRDASHFTRAFAARHGMSPRAWRGRPDT